MCNIFWPKIMFFKILSEIAHELMVMRKPPNAHPRPYLMQKEPTDLLNLPRRKSSFPVEILMLWSCCNIVTVKQMIRWVYKWSLVQGLSNSFDLISLGAVGLEVPHSENLHFCARRFGTYW